MKPVARAGALASVAALAACARTELVVVVDTDIANVDHVVIEATGPSGAQVTSTIAGSVLRSAPGTLVLLPRTRDDETVSIVVTAFAPDTTAYPRTVTTRFVPGQRREVDVVICGACATHTCAAQSGCDPANCGDTPPTATWIPGEDAGRLACGLTVPGDGATEAGIDATDATDSASGDASSGDASGMDGQPDGAIDGDGSAATGCPPNTVEMGGVCVVTGGGTCADPINVAGLGTFAGNTCDGGYAVAPPTGPCASATRALMFTYVSTDHALSVDPDGGYVLHPPDRNSCDQPATGSCCVASCAYGADPDASMYFAFATSAGCGPFEFTVRRSDH